MAHLVERSLVIPEVRSLNPVIGKIYIEHLFTVNYIEKTKIKKKRPGMAVVLAQLEEGLLPIPEIPQFESSHWQNLY